MTEVGYFLIAVGVLFDLFGCIGLVRLPDVYNRLQAATKCVTLGTCLLLIGAAIASEPVDIDIIVASVLCATFVLITSPVGAHALARGSHEGGVKLWEGSVVDRYAEDKGVPAGREPAPAQDTGTQVASEPAREA
jgi:multicomponent Na+:H+ antiporter subunit G